MQEAAAADLEIPKYKIIFLGDQGVGKSSILNRFANDKFETSYQATVGLDFHSKSVKIDNQDVRLLLYDTAGQEKFRSLIPMYIRDANIIIVVYEITRKDSFTHTLHWFEQVKDLIRKDAIFALVGNKFDLCEDNPSNRQVSKDEAQALANERGIIFHEVSAKTGLSINTLFYKDIFDKIISTLKVGGEEENEIPRIIDAKNISAKSKGNKKGGCCK